MSRFGSDASEAGVLLSPFFFDLLHLDGRDLLDEPLSAASTRSPGCWPTTSRRRCGCPASAPPARAGRRGARRRAGRRARGRRGQGARRALRRRPARQGVAEGQAGAHARPRRARRGVGVRPPHGHAVEHPPRRPRPRRRRAGDGGQDLQGHDRRAAGLADADVPRARPRAADWGVLLRPSSWSRSPSTARSAAPATRAASRCGSPASLRYRPDKTPAEADTIDAVRALLAGS